MNRSAGICFASTVASLNMNAEARMPRSSAIFAVIGSVLASVALTATMASVAPAYAADYQAGSIATAAESQFARGDIFKVDGNTYRVTDYDVTENDLGEVVLVKYGSTKKTAAVNTVKYKGETFKVEAVGKNAFNTAQGRKVTSVTLGRNVDEIGSKAFYGCRKLVKLNMAKADVIDIDRNRKGYYIDDIDIGKNAFKNTGTAKLKVNCGSKNSQYQAAYKVALEKRGMRSDVTVVK